MKNKEWKDLVRPLALTMTSIKIGSFPVESGEWEKKKGKSLKWEKLLLKRFSWIVMFIYNVKPYATVTLPTAKLSISWTPQLRSPDCLVPRVSNGWPSVRTTSPAAISHGRHPAIPVQQESRKCRHYSWLHGTGNSCTFIVLCFDHSRVHNEAYHQRFGHLQKSQGYILSEIWPFTAVS